MDRIFDNDMMVTEETMAAWLDGTMSPAEEDRFMQEVATNPELAEILDANDDVEDSYETMVEFGFEEPEWFDSEFDIPEVDDFDDGLDMTSHDEYDPENDSYEDESESDEDYSSEDSNFEETESDGMEGGFDEFEM